MQTKIYMENEEKPIGFHSLVLKRMKERYPDDFLIVISAGDFTSKGTLPEAPCKIRAREYVEAGADLVLSLPVASVLGGYGKKEFAAAALMQRLRVSDHLVIPCTPLPGQTLKECESALRSAAMLMFREEGGYRHRLTENLHSGMHFRDAQLKSVTECFPEAAKLLSCKENQNAVWILDSMLQLYYMAKVEFIQAPEQGGFRKDHLREEAFEKKAAEKVKELLLDGSAEKLEDISGSTSQMTAALSENREKILNASSLEQIAKLLGPVPSDRARLFLLKAILGIRKIYMQICGLHVYVPYCHVCAENPDKTEQEKQLEKESWVPFIHEKEPLPETAKDYYYLLEADLKSASLFFSGQQKETDGQQ